MSSQPPPAYQDDPAIQDEVRLLRRVHPQWIVRDNNLNCLRPSSQAFNNSPDGSPMSVIREDVLENEHRSPVSTLAGYPGYALAALTAGTVRQNGQGVAADPLPEEPAHALVFGNKTESVRRRLAKASRWVVEPPEST